MDTKIVFLLTHHPDPRMLKRAETLSKISKDITMIFWDRSFSNPIPEEIQTKPIRMPDPHSFFGRILVDIRLFFISFRLLKRLKPQIIYVSGFDMLLSAIFYKFFNHGQTKLIFEVADLPGGRFAKRKIMKYISILTNKMIRKADLLVLTSPYFWNAYYKKVFPYQNKVFIMENFPQRVIFKKFIRRKHKKLTIGFIGAVRYAEQIKMLFDASRELKNEVEIIVAGGGPDYDYIKRISDNYNNVKILGPYDYEKDIVNLYSKIDVVYSVYDADLFNVRVAIPNRLYEAIVCGLPIVVAKHTALADFVEKHGIGFAVSHKSVEELQDLIHRMLDNPKILDVCRQNALKMRDNFYYEKMEKEFLNKITNLVLYENLKTQKED